MGSSSIYFTLDGKKTRSEVSQAFKERQESDKHENGHHSGYSGDFQTVRYIKFEDKVFNTQREAFDYCLEHAEKWEYAVAVRYKITSDIKLPKRAEKLKLAIDSISSDLKTVFAELDASARERMKGANVKCTQCKSVIAMQWQTIDGQTKQLSQHDLSCPVCRYSLGDLKHRKIANKIAAKKDKLVAELESIKKDAQTKASEKSEKTNWIVCGWGAE